MRTAATYASEFSLLRARDIRLQRRRGAWLSLFAAICLYIGAHL